MKRIIISLIAIVVAMSVSAAPVDYATALKKVNNYLANKMYPGKQPASLLHFQHIDYLPCCGR